MALDRIIEECGRRYLQPVNPGNGEKGKMVLVSSEGEVRKAAKKAREAYSFWSSLDRKQRGRYFQALKHTVVRHSDEIVKLISEENGKVAVECWEEIMVILQMLHYYRQHGFTDAQTFRGTGPLAICKKIKTTTIPSARGKQLGVVGVIPPWNYPFMIPMNVITRSLHYGNTILLKPSEQTPRTGELIQRLADQAWQESGFGKLCASSPIRVVQGDYVVGETMLNLFNERELDFLVFCGSSGVGRKIKQAAVRKDRLELLLGGKDAFVILEDCDLETTIDALVGSSIFNTGQSCSSTERVYVMENIAELVVEEVLARIKRLKVGYDPNDPCLDLGAIMNEHQFNVIMRQLEDAKAKGARVLFGGRRLRGGMYDKGYYLEPTLLVNVNHSMEIMTEETFGPIIPIMTASTEEELLRLANDSKFGLTASVWTKDIRMGEWFAERLEAGNVYVNDVFWTASEPKVHWPGAKESGNDIDEEIPRGDKVIAVTRGNFIDRLSLFWLKKNTPRKLAFIKNLVRFGYLF